MDESAPVRKGPSVAAAVFFRMDSILIGALAGATVAAASAWLIKGRPWLALSLVLFSALVGGAVGAGVGYRRHQRYTLGAVLDGWKPRAGMLAGLVALMFVGTALAWPSAPDPSIAIRAEFETARVSTEEKIKSATEAMTKLDELMKKAFAAADRPGATNMARLQLLESQNRRYQVLGEESAKFKSAVSTFQQSLTPSRSSAEFQSVVTEIPKAVDGIEAAANAASKNLATQLDAKGPELEFDPEIGKLLTDFIPDQLRFDKLVKGAQEKALFKLVDEIGKEAKRCETFLGIVQARLAEAQEHHEQSERRSLAKLDELKKDSEFGLDNIKQCVFQTRTKLDIWEKQIREASGPAKPLSFDPRPFWQEKTRADITIGTATQLGDEARRRGATEVLQSIQSTTQTWATSLASAVTQWENEKAEFLKSNQTEADRKKRLETELPNRLKEEVNGWLKNLEAWGQSITAATGQKPRTSINDEAPWWVKINPFYILANAFGLFGSEEGRAAGQEVIESLQEGRLPSEATVNTSLKDAKDDATRIEILRYYATQAARALQSGQLPQSVYDEFVASLDRRESELLARFGTVANVVYKALRDNPARETADIQQLLGETEQQGGVNVKVFSNQTEKDNVEQIIRLLGPDIHTKYWLNFLSKINVKGQKPDSRGGP